jgi:uncharacterized RDD family membrane protein YckC
MHDYEDTSSDISVWHERYPVLSEDLAARKASAVVRLGYAVAVLIAIAWWWA